MTIYEYIELEPILLVFGIICKVFMYLMVYNKCVCVYLVIAR